MRILVGLIGAGIGASGSPALHEREGAAQGLQLYYHLMDLEKFGSGVEALPRLLDAAQSLGFAGVNITHPCKQAVMRLLDEVSEEALAIGAVNTVVFGEGKRTGHNTDCLGFAESFQRGLPGVALDRVVLVGAGGGGSAVAHALLRLGTQQLTVVDEDGGRATTLVKRLSDCFLDRRIAVGKLVDAIPLANGVVHATPMGMAAHPGMAIPAELLRPELWVADIVYFPLETELLRAARERGCRVLDGGGMAVFQAAEAFRLFTGIAPDAERMLAAFKAR